MALSCISGENPCDMVAENGYCMVAENRSYIAARELTWIYQHILKDKQAGGDLHQHLRCQKKRRKRYGSYDRRGKLKNRVSIDERPAIVDTRQRLGDWEVDTIIGNGHRHAIVSLTERKSRLALLRKVERKTAQAVADAVIELLKPLSSHLLVLGTGYERKHEWSYSPVLPQEAQFRHNHRSRDCIRNAETQ